MKPHHDFTPERAAAQHCAELIAPKTDAAAKDEAAAQFAASICEALPQKLQAQLGKGINVAAGEASTQTAAALMRSIGKPSASYAVTLPNSGQKILVTFDLIAASSLTDRLFGGDGKTTEKQDNENGKQSGEGLPTSSFLALEKIVRAFAVSLSTAAADDPPQIAHASDASKLDVFARGAACTSWALEVSQSGFDNWTARIAALQETVEAQGTEAEQATAGRLPQTFAEAAMSAPFAAAPLPLTAVLAETRLPLAKLASLKPGDLLPIAARREIPLQIGTDTLAHGKIGTLDDRVALQITQIL